MAQGAERGGLVCSMEDQVMGVFVFVCMFPLASLSGMDIRKARGCREVSSSKGEVRNFRNSQCESVV